MDLVVCKVVINDELEDEVQYDCNSLASNVSEIEYIPLNDEEIDNDPDCVETSSSVDLLLTTSPAQLSDEQRYDLKNKRPTPKLSLKEVSKKQVRTFQTSWYKRFSWLTASTLTQKMYCYVCLMFGENDTDWCINGIFDLNNFIKDAYKHQSTKHHLLNKEKFHMLGNVQIENFCTEIDRHHLIKHNEQVSTNRLVLSRLIQAVLFLGKQELLFVKNVDQCGSNVLGNYVELLDLLSQNELLIRDYLKSSTSFKLTSTDIQSDLIEIITSIIKDKIKTEIKKSTFISIQVDNNIDISCDKQMSVIFRYVIKSRIIERFIGFYDLTLVKNNKTLTEIIRQIFKDWNVEGIQVINQSYDGSIFITDHCKLPDLVREFCPYSLCTHSYAHNLNLTLLYGCKNIKQIRLFLSQLLAFNKFFTDSSKFRELLMEMNIQFKSTPRYCHNYYQIISILLENFTELYRIFNEIIIEINSPCDYETLNSAVVLKTYMNDPKFVYMLCVYKTCLTHIDSHIKYIKSLLKHVHEFNKDIKLAIANIVDLKNDIFIENCIGKSLYLNGNLTFTDENKIELKMLTYEFLDSLIMQMNERFLDIPNLQFIDLLNEEKFNDYNNEFPLEKLLSLLKYYPFFNQEQLQNELHNIYNDKNKHLAPLVLLKYLVMNGLDSVYEEVTKLLHLILAYPILAPDDEGDLEHNSTLYRLKSYLYNNKVNNRTYSLDILAIEKNLAKEFSSDHTFIERVIDVFAEKTNRQLHLVYKDV